MSSFVLLAPLSGAVVPLADVPDPVFSSGMLGDGIGIHPIAGRLLAPCDGTVTHLADTGHAATITTSAGAQVLLHIGIDTVELGGEGFRALVTEGAQVRAGELLVEFDLAAVTRRASSAISVIAIANSDAFMIAQRTAGHVIGGETALLTIRPVTDTQQATATATASGDEVRRQLTLTMPGGLHARPAARARAAARGLDARVELRFGSKSASLDSVVALLGLGAGENAVVELVATGAQAMLAVDAVVQEMNRVAQTDRSHATAANTPGRASSAPGDGPIAQNYGRIGQGGGLIAKGDGGIGQGIAAGTLAGVCAAPGIAIGTLVPLGAGDIAVAELSDGTPQEETRRLEQALAAADATLTHIAHQAKQRGAAGDADIFAVHRVLLEDPLLNAAAHDLITLGKSAGHAWRSAIRQQIEILSRLEDRLLAERAADLRDLEKQVLTGLGHAPAARPTLPDQAILAADDFTPSELATMDRQRVVALVMARGGATSHAAIIARQLGIPALVATGAALHAIPAGGQVILNASAGYLHHAPTGSDLEQARQQQQQQASKRQANRQSSTEPAVTRDGRQIEIAANIATLEDAHAAVAHGADAIGLLRTELLFMHHQSAPSAGEHHENYQRIIDALQGRHAIIRTLDVGADKSVNYLPLQQESNPALGLRGIRLAEQRPDLFDDQLLGLLLVQPAGAARILLPMVTEVAELRRIRQRIDQLARSIGRSDAIEVGVMIEVPAAALLAEQLARHADFLSIGTNDLTQYTLAMDRCHPALAARADGLHPGVLRLIDATVRGAQLHGKWVGVCGALAGDPEAVPVLIGLGVTELSVAPVAIPELKAQVRALDYATCRQHAGELLALESAAQVRAASRERWANGPASPATHAG